MTKRLEMKGIGKSFMSNRALDDVNFSCTAGEVHALVGLNGAGKSTLMKILGGVYQRDEGTIQIDDQDIEIAAPADAGRHGIVMIHQELSLINELTVAGNVFLGRELTYPGTPFTNKREMAQQVKEQLDRFGLKLDPNKPVRELNSGEKQIVEIIRALMSDAWLIVMDEPTSALSEEDKEMLFEFIRRMKSEGIAIIYISHHMPEIFSIAEEVTVMRDGVIVLSEPTAETTEDFVIRSMTGAELDEFVKPHKQISGDKILSIEGLCHQGSYEDISLDVHAGEIVVLTGLRGCGAPELAKAVFGLDAGYLGTVTYLGQVLQPGRGPAKAVQDGMGLVTENRDKNGILPVLSVRDNIALPYLEKFARGGLIDGARIDKTVAKAIRDTSTKTSSPNQEIRFLSGGNKQKICFSRWLDEELRLLILLEPTRGIDVHAKAYIYRIIEELAQRGVAILILSYEIDEVIMLADRVITMYQGETVAEYAYPAFDKDQMLADMAGVGQSH
ncbi:sugar ABC transporter ATP-binding protein [Paracoccus sp. Z330]|uniref:Sugar ABC transporter ATP-binding protein n=1 Tax=Paracoccus onchidii TaxID=3017813 RepID=A0ABT4ZFN6_9RHOB|nr:sugar ABC transporter ATP-binding protein [Paracoccus onchidii]MDB6178195.1 sugar ABC transporter ATP-binding protein [Paracoccus onchidii]